MKDVYAIYETRSEGSERSRWVRVGVAFDNKDGSLNVLLDALPLTGRLQIRAREVDRGSAGNGSEA
jgi:DNA relaxase NicK